MKIDKNKIIYQKYGHLIPYKYVEIPVKHRFNKKNPHSLRCFKMKYQKDKDGNKLLELPKVRCKKHVVEGYLYCRYHGGKQYVESDHLPALAEKNEMSTTARAYKEIYSADLGDLLEKFMNDPNMLDLKPELANMRLILNNYIKKLVERPMASSRNDFMSQLRDIFAQDEVTDDWRFERIMELAESMSTITNGRCIDRINRCIESVGRTVERIHKYEQRGDFVLTPEGLKVMLRAISELLDKSIKDVTLKTEIKKNLLTLSIETKGDVSKYDDVKNITKEVIEIEKDDKTKV